MFLVFVFHITVSLNLDPASTSLQSNIKEMDFIFCNCIVYAPAIVKQDCSYHIYLIRISIRVLSRPSYISTPKLEAKLKVILWFSSGVCCYIGSWFQKELPCLNIAQYLAKRQIKIKGYIVYKHYSANYHCIVRCLSEIYFKNKTN